MICTSCNTVETLHHFDRGDGYHPLCLDCMTESERALVTQTNTNEGNPNV